MRLSPLFVVFSLASLLLLAASSAARAQVGTGWVQYDPPSSIQLDGSNGIESYPGTSTNVRNEGASFTNIDGIETFALHDPVSNRSERRMQNTYQSGRRQFEGEVRVSPPTNDESIQQVFGGNSGATTQMIRAFNEGGGTLKKVPGSVVLAEKVHGVWVKVNVIHDVGANFVKTYINGRLLATGDGEATNAGTDGWYHKYGCYGTLRTGSAKVEWRNVKHFRDGVSPPASDGGAPDAPRATDGGQSPGDAGTDAGVAADASADRASADAGGGTGGRGGAGGSPGTGGSGGAAGTGGSGGTAGAGGGSEGGAGGSDPTPPPAPTPGGCGCRTGGPGGSGGAALWPLLALLLVFRRRGS